MASSSSTLASIVRNVHQAFASGKTRSLEWRKSQLQAMVQMLTETKAQHAEALKQDLRSSDFLVEIEISGSLKEAQTALSCIDEWVKPESVSVPLLMKPASGQIRKEPYGVVLIIAPWNYPLSLAWKPMIGALAAGNAVIVKPSEVSAHCEAVMRDTIPRYFDSEAVKVICGGAEETKELLKQRFDYILYTGGGAVGRFVMQQAAEHLTPVTLELGGKSPCIVDSDVNLDVAARRIVWAKYLNSGQTCVAPDYLLVPKAQQENIVNRLKAVIHQFFGEDPQKSPDYSRVINQRHCARLERLLNEGSHKIEIGGKVDVSDNYISPTILTNVNPKDPVMQDEIFGPILPIIPYESLQEAVEFINSRPKPLALYIYSSNTANQEFILNNTSSGGVAINDSIMQVGCPTLPFGGVGESGMGAYNGHYTFDLFSHNKSILKTPTWLDADVRYPPYTDSKLKTLTFLNSVKLPNGRLILFLLAAIPLAALMLYSRASL